MATMTATTTIADGFYTIVTGNTHRTFRVRTQPQDAQFAPGRQVISYLNGPDNTSDYIGFAFIGQDRIFPWKRFQSGYDQILASARFLVQGDHAEAGLMYAQQSGNCWKCNRLLTTPESIAAGLGPVCASR